MKPKVPLPGMDPRSAGSNLRKSIPHLPEIQPEFPKSPQAQKLVNQLVSVAGQVPGLAGDVLEKLKEKISGDPEDLVEKARAQLRHVVQSKRAAVELCSDIARRAKTPGCDKRLAREVVVPAARKKISASAAWSRTNEIVGKDVLRSAERTIPGWTCGISLGGSLGVLIGGKGAWGLGGLLHRQAFVSVAYGLAAGPYEGGEVAVEVSVAPCMPADFGGASFGIDIDVVVVQGVSVSASVTPRGLLKLLDPKSFGAFQVPSDLDSISASYAVGEAVGVAFFADYTHIDIIMGTADPDPPSAAVPQPAPKLETVYTPANLSALWEDRDEGGTVVLNWMEHSQNEMGFLVERRPSVAGASFERVGSVNLDITHYEESEDLTPGPYDYRVQAFKGAILSDYSNVATVTVLAGRRWRRPGHEAGKEYGS